MPATKPIPALAGIDHVHVYVKDRAKAAQWYQDVLGFRPVERFRVWATPTGPLTVEDPSGRVHLALFESERPPTSTIAFGASGREFVAWKRYLTAQGLKLRVTDHQLAWSLYFEDPDGNLHEITTEDHAEVAAQMQG